MENKGGPANEIFLVDIYKSWFLAIWMIDVDAIIAELYLKYNISHSTLMKLKTFLGKVGDYKYGYFMTEVPYHKTIEITKKMDDISGKIYLPPKEYIRVKYNAIIFAIVERNKQGKLHYHRIILTNQKIDYADIQKRYGKYYKINFELLNVDPETIKKVLKYMFKQKKKNENEQ